MVKKASLYLQQRAIVVHVHVGLDTVAGQSTRHSALDPTQLQALGCEKSLVGLRWIDPPRLGPFLG